MSRVHHGRGNGEFNQVELRTDGDSHVWMGSLFNAFKEPCPTGDWVVILPAAFPELKE